MKRGCCSVLPYPEPAGAGFAPLAGLPQDAPSLWYDADSPANLVAGANISEAQARYGTGRLPAATAKAPVVFGTKRAFAAANTFRDTTGATAYNAHKTQAGVFSLAAVIAGVLPTTEGAIGSYQGFSWGALGSSKWYPFWRKNQNAIQKTVGYSPGDGTEVASTLNVLSHAGKKFVFAYRMQSGAHRLCLWVEGVGFTENTNGAAVSSSSGGNLWLGEFHFGGSQYSSNIACYGVMTGAYFTDANVRTLCEQTKAYYGL